eukprot:TRINITY_DN2369_c0_g2_i1.p1 TRINITY_DN2369_c0_g2~~TRINITY_DN2369_c0_g2_i1.p1  ORF type:complete len:124 (-),score=15.26 TRINITY_DN2369_c0_g2_i1:218-589(-)
MRSIFSASCVYRRIMLSGFHSSRKALSKENTKDNRTDGFIIVVDLSQPEHRFTSASHLSNCLSNNIPTIVVLSNCDEADADYSLCVEEDLQVVWNRAMSQLDPDRIASPIRFIRVNTDGWYNM